VQTNRSRKKQPAIINDLNLKILSQWPKEYMELKVFKESVEKMN
jgi:hypothetical protein